jgi:flagellar biosynthesis/type III secretory pathway chaperone
VAEAWRKVVFFAHKARDANELNGAIVNAHLEFTQEAIQVLRQGGAGPNEMYGRNSRGKRHRGRRQSGRWLTHTPTATGAASCRNACRLGSGRKSI